jgi:hypothetical protein
MICSSKPWRPIAIDATAPDHFVVAITSADANVRHTATDVTSTSTSVARMITLGTPELVLVLIALGGMTAAATWGVIELKRPRK